LFHVAKEAHKWESMTDIWLEWEGMRELLKKAEGRRQMAEGNRLEEDSDPSQSEASKSSIWRDL
jgi:hypothetical protein